jgi:hypothetical protein
MGLQEESHESVAPEISGLVKGDAVICHGGNGELVFLDQRKKDANQRIRVSLAKTGDALNQTVNLSSLMKRHPIVLTGSALGLGFIAAVIVAHWAKKNPVKTYGKGARHHIDHGSTSGAWKNVARTFIAELIVKIIQRWGATDGNPSLGSLRDAEQSLQDTRKI